MNHELPHLAERFEEAFEAAKSRQWEIHRRSNVFLVCTAHFRNLVPGCKVATAVRFTRKLTLIKKFEVISRDGAKDLGRRCLHDK
jgi:hypothetical protein